MPDGKVKWFDLPRRNGLLRQRMEDKMFLCMSQLFEIREWIVFPKMWLSHLISKGRRMERRRRLI